VDPLTLPAVMYDPPLSDAAMIWQLVEELGPDLRKVIALRYLGDLSLEEIARALGIPLGTVKSRLHIAHKRLKEMLDDKEQKGVGNIEA